MSEFVIQLTEEELNRQANLTRNSLSLNFENNSFKKGPTFSLGMREQASKYCQKIMAKKLKSLIVEGPYSLTIWIQEQISSHQNDNQESNKNSPPVNSVKTESQINPASDKNHPQELETQKKTRHYRGQTSEVEIPLPKEQISTSESENQTTPTIPTKKVIKRYRGQTYEVEVPDYSAMESKLQNKEKPRRKYRGQYID